jgi:hypothetical protein
MDRKLADLTNVRLKETREDRDNADKRGGQSPLRRLGNLDHRGHTGARMAGIQNLFICLEYYLVLRLPLSC